MLRKTGCSLTCKLSDVMKSRLLLILMIIFCASSCIDETPAGPDLKTGDSLPDFSVEMNDGTVVSSSYIKNSVSCVVFFHTSCPDCQKALPEVQKLYENFSSDVRFVLISREEDDASISAFWKEKGLNMPYSAQSDRRIYSLFAQSRIPRVYISSKGGRIEAIFTDDPGPSYEDMAEVLERLY